jgi:hypothetical protein
MNRLVASLACLALVAPSPAQQTDAVDVIVYGGTAAGVVAAVEIASAGKRVALIEPSKHLGGMTTSGLGATDVGNKDVIGGRARAFYRAVRAHYEQPAAWTRQARAAFAGHGHREGEDAAWTFEPHVAERILAAWAAAPGITVLLGERLDRTRMANRAGARLLGIRLVSGRELAARTFVDATYEGDLLAHAGVSFHVGREANAEFGESLNGVQTAHAVHHQFRFPVDPYVRQGEPASGLLPGIGAGPGAEGSADQRVQAYCYRLCATDVADNRRPWPKPARYDERDYELLLRHFDAGDQDIPWHPVLMPNRKTDANNNKAVSTDAIGMNWNYPEASDAERTQIVARHLEYTQGLLWTLAQHPRVPAHVRAHFTTWGLAKDEFTDNDNWPYQPYVREARRMRGMLVMTEHHCRGAVKVDDPVGMGAYSMDSHNVQRYVDARGHVRNEGDVQVRVPPYGIALRALLPLASECDNLVVPVALSATHIAYGSIRMEPVFMVLAQSAALLVLLALEGDMPVQAVPYDALRTRLLAAGQVLEHASAREEGIAVATLRGHVADDRTAQFTGAWQESTSSRPFVGHGYHHDGDASKGERRARFVLELPGGGEYDLQLAYTPGHNRATNVPVVVHAHDGLHRVVCDQRRKPSVEGLWHPLGTFRAADDGRLLVEVETTGTDGHVVVDAVRALPR